MKRTLAALLMVAVILCATHAMAQVWYDANQVTFAWDAVTKLADGTTIPAGNTVKYQVYSKPNSVSTGVKVGTEITATQLLISFSVEGSYFLGVEALRYNGTTLISKSAPITWSDVAANCQGGVAFGVNYWLSLMQPAGLRRLP
jgi:hypothetical protein